MVTHSTWSLATAFLTVIIDKLFVPDRSPAHCVLHATLLRITARGAVPPV